MNELSSKPHVSHQGQSAGLWVCAVCLAFLVLVQAGLSFGQPEGFAKAEHSAGMVSQTQSATLLAADGGAEDMILVLDERTETLSVYHLDIRGGLQPLQRLPLPRAFLDAKASSYGRP
ncbi:MAG: hypothetical protein GC200_03075 [Tepidisphaera sp.]|nr:hypothetical protein [Tepidisphaera sp.]